jgi:uncharacterized OB-fold protein
VSSPTQAGFFAGAREGKLTGIRCTACGGVAIPPKAFCERCGKRAWETIPLSGNGTIDSFTIIRVAPRAFVGQAPYAIAAVRLVEGVALLGRLVDVPLDKIAVGMRVRFRPLVDNGRTAIAFGPA